MMNYEGLLGCEQQRGAGTGSTLQLPRAGRQQGLEVIYLFKSALVEEALQIRT